MPNLNVGLFAAIVVGALGCASSNTTAYGAAWTNNIGWAQPCRITGNSDAQLTPQCYSWCRNQFGTTNYDTNVSATRCSTVGITDTQYFYCCVNQAAIDILNNCKCPDSNQITVLDKNDGTAYTVTSTGDGDYETLQLTCNNLYCFCDTWYYGERKSLNQAKSGDCTECPCSSDITRVGSSGTACGWTANNYLTLTDNTKAPSTTLADCKIGPASSATPEEYRRYYDSSGNFILTDSCPYEVSNLCGNVSYKCSNNSTTQYTLGTPSDTAGSGCWCHANNKYIFNGTMGVAEGCLAGCEASCKNVVSSNPTVHTLLGCDG